MGEKLHIDIAYEGRLGFLQCFVYRFIDIKEPVFLIKDAKLELGCKQAFIEPNFSKLITKKTIILRCGLQDAKFLHLKEKIKENDDYSFLFQGDVSKLLDRIIDFQFDVILTTLFLYGETVEFKTFEARSKDINIYASGKATESGNISLKAKFFFSPEIVKEFPEEVNSLLTEESRGWLSYSLELEGGQETPFLNINSDRIKIEFKKINVN